MARGDQDRESDLDLVVDLEEGRSLLDLSQLIVELEDLFGCPVNVVERKLLGHDAFARNVRRDAVPV